MSTATGTYETAKSYRNDRGRWVVYSRRLHNTPEAAKAEVDRANLGGGHKIVASRLDSPDYLARGLTREIISQRLG